ncbi:hypothetical protein ACOSP7_023073 [Xanthoceras sorbifolium]
MLKQKYCLKHSLNQEKIKSSMDFWSGSSVLECRGCSDLNTGGTIVIKYMANCFTWKPINMSKFEACEEFC